MECGGRGKPGVVLLMLMSRLGRPVRVVTPPASCLFWSVSWDRRGLTFDFDVPSILTSATWTWTWTRAQMIDWLDR